MSGTLPEGPESTLVRKVVCAILVAIFAIGICWYVTVRSSPPPPPNPIGLEP